MSFSFANIGLPLAGLVALTVLLPVLIVGSGGASQGRLALGMGLAALLVFAAAMGWFALAQLQAGDALRLGALVRPALMSALAWGPVWALVWLVRAQGVERRKGEALVRAGMGGDKAPDRTVRK